MRLLHPLRLAALVTALAVHGLAAAAADPSRYQITPAMLQKLKAAEADVKKVAPKRADDEDDADGDQDLKSVEEIAREAERTPALKAALARHGISAMDYAQTVHASLHAGMYLMFEAQMDPKKRAATLAGYTPQQRANIELLRKTMPAAKN